MLIPRTTGKNWSVRDQLISGNILPVVEALVTKFSRDSTVLEVFLILAAELFSSYFYFDMTSDLIVVVLQWGHFAQEALTVAPEAPTTPA